MHANLTMVLSAEDHVYFTELLDEDELIIQVSHPELYKADTDCVSALVSHFPSRRKISVYIFLLKFGSQFLRKSS